MESSKTLYDAAITQTCAENTLEKTELMELLSHMKEERLIPFDTGVVVCTHEFVGQGFATEQLLDAFSFSLDHFIKALVSSDEFKPDETEPYVMKLVVGEDVFEIRMD